MFNGIFATGFTGGTLDDLNFYDGTDLIQNDFAVVVNAGDVYFYYLNATSGEAESSPDIIAPLTNAGTKRWKRLPTIGADGVDGVDGTVITMAVLSKSSSVNQNVGGGNGTEVYWLWDGEIKKDSGFIHDNISNSGRLQVSTAGWYELNFSGGCQQGGSARTTAFGIFRINGGSTQRRGTRRNYSRGSSYANLTASLSCVVYLSANDYVEVGTRIEDTDSSYTINTSGSEVNDDEHTFSLKFIGA
jgi:hypothetical protein